ncbi:MAG TPA: ABC transporter ATP-binding protein [Clostridia bacterium]|nr:ABC transporter ATP-binding protein [Clostridia bacterium]
MRQETDSQSAALAIRDLSVSYGRIDALKHVNLEIREGEIVAILGANGAGKSSLLRAISALVPVSGGEILSHGKPIHTLPAEKLVSRGIVQSPEGRQIFSDLTVEDNLIAGGFTVSASERKANLAMVYERFPILGKRAKQVAGTLSGGEQQMLAIGRALMANPKILLLDEPSLGLAPLIVRDILNIIEQLNEQGVTVVLVEQNAKQSLKIADYAYVLEVGTISIEGPAEELLKDDRVIEAYLGKS